MAHTRKKIKILFADNDADFLSTRAEYLVRAGFTVIQASSLAEADSFLREMWFPLAILDIRMTDDDDEKDVSGMTLVKADFTRAINKIVLTNFPDMLIVHDLLLAASHNGLLTIHVIHKHDGPEKLIQTINEALDHHTGINWDLGIEWKGGDPHGLVNLIESNLEDAHLLSRAQEIEDLLRRLFFENEQIRVVRQLWHRNNRVALVVFSFREGTKPGAHIVVCGPKNEVSEEAKRFDEFSPSAFGNTGTALGSNKRVETTHFAANAYTLAGNNLENAHTLSDLYRMGSDKVFAETLMNLFKETLGAWHQNKLIRRDTALEDIYRERLHLLDNLTNEYFDERTRLLEYHAPTVGSKIYRSGESISISFPNSSFSYLDPIPYVFRSSLSEEPAVLITGPGVINGNNIITDTSLHTWLTDFAESGLVPILWNFVALETVIRYDWVETNNLLRRHELEQRLIFSDFVKLDTRDLELEVRKPARAIQSIRKLAARTAGSDYTAYHIGVFFHAAYRLANFNPSSPLTSSELARLAHILFSMAMLATRIENKQATKSVPRSNGMMIDKHSHMVFIGDNPIHIPPQPFSILLYLYDNDDKVCTSQELVEGVLAGNYDENYLHTLIGRIRKLIETDPEQPRYIVTERNVGYRLIKQPM